MHYLALIFLTLSLPNISNAHIAISPMGPNELYIQDKREKKKKKSIPKFSYPFKKKKKSSMWHVEIRGRILLALKLKKKQIVQNHNDVNTNMSRSSD